MLFLWKLKNNLRTIEKCSSNLRIDLKIQEHLVILDTKSYKQATGIGGRGYFEIPP